MARRGRGFQQRAVDRTWTSTHVTHWTETPLQGTADVLTRFTGCPRVTGRHSAPVPCHLLVVLRALWGRFEATGACWL